MLGVAGQIEQGNKLDFVINFHNTGGDLALVMWSGAVTINTNPPELAITIPADKSATISMNGNHNNAGFAPMSQARGSKLLNGLAGVALGEYSTR